MFEDREALEVFDLIFHDQVSFTGGCLVEHWQRNWRNSLSCAWVGAGRTKRGRRKSQGGEFESWWALFDGQMAQDLRSLLTCLICLYGPAESRNVELTLFLQSCALCIFDSRNWTRRRRLVRRFRTSFSTANLWSCIVCARPICVFV